MRKIKLFITALLFSITSMAFANTDNPLTIKVDSVSYQRLNADPDVCCHYNIVLSEDVNGEHIIYHSESGVVLGRVMGPVTADYLVWLKENVLTDDAVADIVNKTLIYEGRTNQSGL